MNCFDKIVEWKNGGRSLYSMDGGFRTTACLNFLNDMSLGYVEGYRRAGLILYESLVQSNSTPDFLVYPILFCYRHHFEIQLKRILDKGLKLIESSEGIGLSHKIDKPWERVKIILDKIYGKDKTDFIASIDHFLYELNDLDPKGEELRYNRRSDGLKSLSDLSHISLDNIVEIFEEIADCLDAIATDFDVKFDYMCQAMFEAQAENFQY